MLARRTRIAKAGPDRSPRAALPDNHTESEHDTPHAFVRPSAVPGPGILGDGGPRLGPATGRHGCPIGARCCGRGRRIPAGARPGRRPDTRSTPKTTRRTTAGSSSPRWAGSGREGKLRGKPLLRKGPSVEDNNEARQNRSRRAVNAARIGSSFPGCLGCPGVYLPRDSWLDVNPTDRKSVVWERV